MRVSMVSAALVPTEKPRERRGRALHEIAHPAHIDDRVILPSESTMPKKLADHAERSLDADARSREVRMGDRERERVCGIARFNACHWQQTPHHRLHLLLAGMSRTDHTFLDVVGGIFGDFESGARSGEDRDRARLPELQGGGWILVHKGQLDSHGPGHQLDNDPGKCVVQSKQPLAQRLSCVGCQNAMGDVRQTVPGDFR